VMHGTLAFLRRRSRGRWRVVLRLPGVAARLYTVGRIRLSYVRHALRQGVAFGVFALACCWAAASVSAGDG